MLTDNSLIRSNENICVLAEGLSCSDGVVGLGLGTEDRTVEEAQSSQVITERHTVLFSGFKLSMDTNLEQTTTAEVCFSTLRFH